MCRELVSSFRSYEVQDVRWSELDAQEIARVRAIPCWCEALNTERIAARHIRRMVEAERDAVVREALALQGYEEARHAALFESPMQHDRIDVPVPPPYRPRDPV
jgi:hypothetical protein